MSNPYGNPPKDFEEHEITVSVQMNNEQRAKQITEELCAKVGLLPTQFIVYQHVESITAALDSKDAELRELVEALEFYAKAKHVMRESEPRPGNVCPPFGHYAREALAKFRAGRGA